MSETVDFITCQSVTASALESVVERVSQHFSITGDLTGKGWAIAFFYPTRVSAFDGQGITFLDLCVTGRLSLGDEALLQQAAAYAQLERAFTGIAGIGMRVGFEEKQSRQSKRGYDTVGLGRISKNESRLFSYSANGSLVMKNREYGKQFIQELIRVAELPIHFIDSSPRPSLEHASGGYLNMRKGFTAFKCALPNETVEESVGRVRRVLEHCATPKRLDRHWNVNVAASGTPGKANEILARTAKLGLPAESLEVNGRFILEEPCGVAAIQRLCGPEDVVFSPLCSFDLEPPFYANLSVKTTAEGHWIELELIDESALPEIEEALGLEFVRDQSSDPPSEE
jgi:hypothetical protein